MYWFPFRYLGTFSGNVNVTLGKLSMGTFRERSLGTFFMVFGERSENVLGTFPCWLGSYLCRFPNLIPSSQKSISISLTIQVFILSKLLILIFGCHYMMTTNIRYNSIYFFSQISLHLENCDYKTPFNYGTHTTT